MVRVCVQFSSVQAAAVFGGERHTHANTQICRNIKLCNSLTGLQSCQFGEYSILRGELAHIFAHFSGVSIGGFLL